MSEFLKSNKALDDVIRSARTVAEMRESMLTELAAQGSVIRDRQDPYDLRVIPQSPEPPTLSVSLPAENGRPMRKASDTWSRVVIDGNSHFELFGNSEQDLNDQETTIRAILSGRS